MAPFIIREASPEDSDAIAEVLRITWLSTYTNKEHNISKEDIGAINFNRPVINSETKQNWVAEKEGRIVGVCKAYRTQERGRVNAFYILHEFQSGGIGSHLLLRALKWFGAIPVFVNVAIYNERARAFYLKHGFIETGKSVSSAAARLPSGQIIPEINLVLKKQYIFKVAH